MVSGLGLSLPRREFDKLGLGKIEIFTKPGADRYHAQVDYNFANDFWNSRNPYSAVKAPFLLNELEGNAGGPLGKRSSFTLDFQRNSMDNGAIANGVRLDTATLERYRLRSMTKSRSASCGSPRASTISLIRTTH